MNFKKIIIIFSLFCALASGAQNFTATYVELADSADYYIDKKMWPEAEKVIIKALKHEPANKSNYLLWSNLGLVRENMALFPGAVEAYTVGLSSAPKSTVLLTNRARAFLAMDRPEEALEDLNAVISLDSTLQWPLKMRGLVLASLQRNSDALLTLKKYKEHFGHDAGVSEAMADIYAGQGDFENAISAYREAYETEEDQDLLVKMLLTAYSYGRIEEMSDEITTGIKKFPRNATLYLIRAVLNKSRYQTDAYESDLKTALNLGVDKELFNYITKK